MGKILDYYYTLYWEYLSGANIEKGDRLYRPEVWMLGNYLKLRRPDILENAKDFRVLPPELIKEDEAFACMLMTGLAVLNEMEGDIDEK